MSNGGHYKDADALGINFKKSKEGTDSHNQKICFYPTVDTSLITGFATLHPEISDEKKVVITDSFPHPPLSDRLTKLKLDPEIIRGKLPTLKEAMGKYPDE